MVSSKPRRRPRPGDVFQLRTPKGLAYLQYTIKDPLLGYLIRVLPGLFEGPPECFADLAAQEEQFFVFFPLGGAVYRGIVQWVAHELIPEWAQMVPPMRVPWGIRRDGRFVRWKICDGDTETLADELTDDQKKLSPGVIWNDTLLIERICQGWKPEDNI